MENPNEVSLEESNKWRWRPLPLDKLMSEVSPARRTNDPPPFLKEDSGSSLGLAVLTTGGMAI